MEVIDGPQMLKFAVALVFVLSLMGLLGLLMRRINGGALASPLGRRRLRIVESLPLDGRRRLVLVARDKTEHLVILGTNGETVVETGISRPQDESSASPLKETP